MKIPTDQLLAVTVKCTPVKTFFDPLDEDAVEDPVVTTTERRLIRLTLAACDVGARFARDHLDLDPGAWMLTSQTLFDGQRGMDACQDLEPFIRSIVVHGLNLALDVSPSELRGISEDIIPTSDQNWPHSTRP